jgi:hypothetical protein
MANKTEYLTEKINMLRGMIQQDAVNAYSHELSVADAAAGSTGSDLADQQIRATADSAKQALAIVNRRLATRRQELATLEAELNAPTSGQ